MKSFQLRISGRVQNVGFRYHTYEKAVELGLHGFVTNQSNGDVYIEIEGEEDAVNEFIIWAHKGPNWARVLEVQVREQPVCNYSLFEIRR